jgi:predicted NUDIX family phosphoesterase
VLGGLRKELEEEVAVDCAYSLEFAGILNDDTTDVGRVHLGAVFVLEAAARRVSVLETEKMTGQWVKVRDLPALREAMETWSQIAYDKLIAPR